MKISKIMDANLRRFVRELLRLRDCGWDVEIALALALPALPEPPPYLVKEPYISEYERDCIRELYADELGLPRPITGVEARRLEVAAARAALEKAERELTAELETARRIAERKAAMPAIMSYGP